MWGKYSGVYACELRKPSGPRRPVTLFCMSRLSTQHSTICEPSRCARSARLRRRRTSASISNIEQNNLVGLQLLAPNAPIHVTICGKSRNHGPNIRRCCCMVDEDGCSSMNTTSLVRPSKANTHMRLTAWLFSN